MRHIVLASHHRFAEGLADTLAFLGCQARPHVICAYLDERPLAPMVDELFATFDPADEVLVLTDILQGSVSQAFAPHMNDRVFLVTGATVSLALELCLSNEPLTAEAIEQSIELARSSICLVNSLTLEKDDDDE